MMKSLSTLALISAVTFAGCTSPAADAESGSAGTDRSLVAARFQEFTVPEGTTLEVRLDSALNSDTSHVEDPINAILSDSVVVNGTDVFPAGSIVKGEVAAVQSAGKVKGRGTLTLRFTSIAVAGRDEPSSIAARTELTAASTKGKDAAKVAVPAAGGAIIGGILGGKKGAVIGTAVGGGGGAAVVMSSGNDLELARGTLLTVPLDRAVTVRVPAKAS